VHTHPHTHTCSMARVLPWYGMSAWRCMRRARCARTLRGPTACVRLCPASWRQTWQVRFLCMCICVCVCVFFCVSKLYLFVSFVGAFVFDTSTDLDFHTRTHTHAHTHTHIHITNRHALAHTHTHTHTHKRRALHTRGVPRSQPRGTAGCAHGGPHSFCACSCFRA